MIKTINSTEISKMGGIILMWIEMFITLLIVAFAVYILYKNLKTTSKGNCGCGKCSPKHKRIIGN